MTSDCRHLLQSRSYLTYVLLACENSWRSYSLVRDFFIVLEHALDWINRYLDVHVMEGYTFLMQNYRAGDTICIFGFSRGAYTARALGGMLFKVHANTFVHWQASNPILIYLSDWTPSQGQPRTNSFRVQALSTDRSSGASAGRRFQANVCAWCFCWIHGCLVGNCKLCASLNDSKIDTIGTQWQALDWSGRRLSLSLIQIHLSKLSDMLSLLMK